NTALADDPELTVRLPGLESRSPVRIVLDRLARLDPASKLAQSAQRVPVLVAAATEADAGRRGELEALGVKFLSTDTFEGRIALPELLEDLAAQGMMDVLVEGGAGTARAFLEDGMVDRVVLFQGPQPIEAGGIAAPVSRDHMPE